MNNEKKTNHWGKIFNQFEESGLGINQFCKNNNMTPSQFHYWKKRIGYKVPTAIKDKISSQNFIDIEPKSKVTGSEITFIISGHKITFSKLPEPNWIAQFAKELGNESSST